MKTILSLLLIFFSLYLNAQNVMGNAPAGSTIKYPNELIISQVVGNGDSLAFDIDCDSIPDIKFVVVRGALAIDGHSNAFCGSLDTNVEICLSPGLHYYNMGDTAICDSPFIWSNHSRYLFSCLGMDCMLINIFSDTFITYRKQINPNVYQYGWAKISLNLMEPAPSLTLKEYLSFCYPLSTDNFQKNESAIVYPTIFDHKITIETGSNENYDVELYTQYGQKLLSSQNIQTIKTDHLPAGFYFLKIIAGNFVSSHKLIKY